MNVSLIVYRGGTGVRVEYFPREESITSYKNRHSPTNTIALRFFYAQTTNSKLELIFFKIAY